MSTRRANLRVFVAWAIGGWVVVVAASVLVVPTTGDTVLFLGNGCVPPCPHTEVEYQVDLWTGARTAVLTTTNVDGSLMSRESENGGSTAFHLPGILIWPGVLGLIGGLAMAARSERAWRPRLDSNQGPSA